jgi:predicted DCC family thiol-disulfide oxidoreductase YuxK
MTIKQAINKGHEVILFDGECHLCSRSVHFIIQRDKKAHYKFAPLSHPEAQEIIQKTVSLPLPQTMYLIRQEQILMRSTAPLTICKNLTYPWKLCTIFLFVPTFIRDGLYNIVVKNRHRFFKSSCTLPTEEHRTRIID